jgi:hypothetical protein
MFPPFATSLHLILLLTDVTATDADPPETVKLAFAIKVYVSPLTVTVKVLSAVDEYVPLLALAMVKVVVACAVVAVAVHPPFKFAPVLDTEPNSLWLFEKRFTLLKDTCPSYQVTVMLNAPYVTKVPKFLSIKSVDTRVDPDKATN